MVRTNVVVALVTALTVGLLLAEVVWWRGTIGHLDDENDRHQHHSRPRPGTDKKNNNTHHAIITKITLTHHHHHEPRPSFNITAEEEFCRTPANCYSARCFVDDHNNVSSLLSPRFAGCVPNPYYYRRLSENLPSTTSVSEDDDANDDDEFNCVHTSPLNRRSDKPALLLERKKRLINDAHDQKKSSSSSSSSSQQHHQQQQQQDAVLQEFLLHTSWMFNKWFNWSAEQVHSCVPKQRLRHSGRMRGSHRPTDNLFELENFCLKPYGKLSGFSPTMDRYRGTDDTFAVTREREGEIPAATDKWINNKNNIEALSQPHSCYYSFSNKRVVLFPVDQRSSNVGHAYYRAGSMLRTIEAAFGEKARDQLEDVLVIYVVTTDGEHMEENNNGFKKFYQIIGTHHAAVFAEWDRFSAHKLLKPGGTLEKLLGFAPSSQSPLRTPICFQSAIVWMNGHADFMARKSEDDQQEQHENPGKKLNKAKKRHNNSRHRDDDDQDDTYEVGRTNSKYGLAALSSAAADSPGRQTSYHIHGPRSHRDTETLHMLDRRLRLCGDLPPRRRRRHQQHGEEKSKKPLHVVFAVRSTTRRFTLQPFVIADIARYINNINSDNNNNNNAKTSSSSSSSSSSKTQNHQITMMTFEVFEHIHLPFREVIARMSRADILVGMYGAALVWQVFMPPGSVTIEIDTWGMSYCAGGSGLDRSPTSEFGGGAIAAEQHHIALLDPGLLVRFPGSSKLPTHFDNTADGRMFTFALDKARCIFLQEEQQLNNNNNNNNNSKIQRDVRHRRRLCDFRPRVFFNMTREIHQDADVLARMAYLSLPASSSSASSPLSRRLRVMIRKREAVAMFLSSFRNQAEATIITSEGTVKPYETSLLIVEDCQADVASSLLSGGIVAEVVALRAIIQRIETIVVAQNALGFETCRRRRALLFNTTTTTTTQTQTKTSSWSARHAMESIKVCDFPCADLFSRFGVYIPFDLAIADYSEEVERLLSAWKVQLSSGSSSPRVRRGGLGSPFSRLMTFVHRPDEHSSYVRFNTTTGAMLNNTTSANNNNNNKSIEEVLERERVQMIVDLAVKLHDKNAGRK